jgi:phosphatidylglycerophosphate synthase
MMGLYSLKPWFATKLTMVRRVLIEHDVSPNTISVFGIVFAAVAGVSLALLPAPIAALPVLVFLVLRLAAANLDGSVARETGKQTRWGSVLNEVGDRAADLLLLAGLLPHLPLALALGLLLAASGPSWISLAGAAAGLPRLNGGPMGKTDRCLLLVLAAATGWYLVVAVAVIVGSVCTVALRLTQIASDRGITISPPEFAGADRV